MRLTACAALLGMACIIPMACVTQPEEALVGCWSESKWSYEKADSDAFANPAAWNDGVRAREYPDRQVLWHAAEHWEFKPKGELLIHQRDGLSSPARWRLKGRGHVLTIRYGTDRFEVYDIKELTSDELILNFDMGVEVRGIARLEFARTRCPAPTETRPPTARREARRSDEGDNGAS